MSDALVLNEDTGIWTVADATAVAYPEAGHGDCFRVEETSFWFRHRNRCLVEALARHPPGGFILDVGGGNGYVARGLADAGHDMVLLEPGSVGAVNARHHRRLPAVIHATLDAAAIRTASVPAVGLFDVLEHIDDHEGFVRELARITRPGGHLYLTVPAFPWLWCAADDEAQHYRRYTADSMRAVLQGCFDIVYWSYLFRRLVPAFALARTLPYRLGLTRSGSATSEADHASGSATIGRIIDRLLQDEIGAVRNGRSLGVGSSLLVVARRTS